MHRDEIRWFDSNEHILTESWLQIVEVAIISVGMSVQWHSTDYVHYFAI
jgi:hypothetical protein